MASRIRVESEEHAVRTACALNPKLFHIRMAGSLHRIDIRPPQRRADLFEQTHFGSYVHLLILG